MDKSLENIISVFGNELYYCMKDIKDLNEIRIRIDKPVMVYINAKPFLAGMNRELIPLNFYDRKKNYIIIAHDVMKQAFSKICQYSVYKYQNDINNGFITLSGGHRIGICGTAINNNSNINNISNITSLNIRAAKEYQGCSDTFFRCVDFKEGVLICGVPCTGKTTLLRDIALKLSTKYCYKVSVIDERAELSSLNKGHNIFDLGFSDIYCGYPKSIGIIQAIRTMSPDYIVCDELTGSDVDSVMRTVNYGVNMIAAVHCESAEKIKKNPCLLSLLKTRAFKTIVFLKSGMFGELEQIYELGDIIRD